MRGVRGREGIKIKIMDDKEKYCEICKWHVDFSWVCFNGESEKRADFTNNDDCCIEWESREDKS